RQGGQGARPAVSGRATDRQGRQNGGSGGDRVSTRNEWCRRPGLRFLVLRAENGGRSLGRAAGERGCRGAGGRRRGIVPGGRGGRVDRQGRAGGIRFRDRNIGGVRRGGGELAYRRTRATTV